MAPGSVEKKAQQAELDEVDLLHDVHLRIASVEDESLQRHQQHHRRQGTVAQPPPLPDPPDSKTQEGEKDQPQGSPEHQDEGSRERLEKAVSHQSQDRRRGQPQER